MNLFFATRPSALARWQTGWVMQRLQDAWPGLQCRELIITTKGDRTLDQPLPKIGGKGIFTQELEADLFNKNVDVAVHSLKDLPVDSPPGLSIGAIPARADARDVLISNQGYRLSELPPGAKVGTSSLRRSVQLLSIRPDLKIESLRGNVDTRLRKALESQYDAIVLAGAGLTRLGLQEHITEWLPFDVMLPAPGQGALAVQCRSDDQETLRLLAVLDNPATRQSTTAERAFLSGLGGGCAVPVAAYATSNISDNRSTVELTGLVAALDGKRVIRVQSAGNDPLALGDQLAQQALQQGANEILFPII